MKLYVITFIKIGKTFKELSYEIKLQEDEIAQIYRNAYKTQNAKKQRNRHIKEIDERFKDWVIKAQEKKNQCSEKKISLEEFKQWLKNNENWHIRRE